MIERHLTASVLEALEDTPVVLIEGARQSGKSTLVRQIIAGPYPAQYYTMDDPGTLHSARTDPMAFLRGIEGPAVLDEVQRTPALFPIIKLLVDQDRRPGRFLLTGSANVLLLPKLSESLTGRMEILTLWPFSQSEILGRPGEFIQKIFGGTLPRLLPKQGTARDLRDRLLVGGYPEAVAKKTPGRRKSWFAAYIATMLSKEVRELAEVDGLANLPRLLELLATRAGSLLNYADLSRDSAIPQSTLKRYLGIFHALFLVQITPPWSGNLGVRLVKAPKVHFGDSGLLAHLLQVAPERLVQDSGHLGRLLENFVASELRKMASLSPDRMNILHFRTQNGAEVDLVLEKGIGRVVGIEVKAGAIPQQSDFRGLKALAEQAGDGFVRGILLYGGTEIIPFGKNLHAVPISALWEW